MWPWNDPLKEAGFLKYVSRTFNGQGHNSMLDRAQHYKSSPVVHYRRFILGENIEMFFGSVQIKVSFCSAAASFYSAVTYLWNRSPFLEINCTGIKLLYWGRLVSPCFLWPEGTRVPRDADKNLYLLWTLLSLHPGRTWGQIKVSLIGVNDPPYHLQWPQLGDLGAWRLLPPSPSYELIYRLISFMVLLS